MTDAGRACDGPPVSRRLVTCSFALLFLIAAGGATPVVAADDGLKEGWTPKILAAEAHDCTEATVKDAWENTKRMQGADESLPLTPKIRKELAPQIATMKKLCDCAIREAAKRYTRAEAEATPSDLQAFIADVVAKGTCKVD